MFMKEKTKERISSKLRAVTYYSIGLNWAKRIFFIIDWGFKTWLSQLSLCYLFKHLHSRKCVHLGLIPQFHVYKYKTFYGGSHLTLVGKISWAYTSSTLQAAATANLPMKEKTVMSSSLSTPSTAAKRYDMDNSKQ